METLSSTSWLSVGMKSLTDSALSMNIGARTPWYRQNALMMSRPALTFPALFLSPYLASPTQQVHPGFSSPVVEVPAGSEARRALREACRREFPRSNKLYVRE